MSFAEQFTDGGVYQLPDGTRIVARWQPPQDTNDLGCWRFVYFDSGEMAIEVFSSGLIGQADPPSPSRDIGPFRLHSTRLTRSDLTIDDIRPA